MRVALFGDITDLPCGKVRSGLVCICVVDDAPIVVFIRDCDVGKTPGRERGRNREPSFIRYRRIVCDQRTAPLSISKVDR